MPRRTAQHLRHAAPARLLLLAAVALASPATALLASCGRSQGASPRVVLPGTDPALPFSHASLAGDLVFVSGTLGTRPGTFELVPGGVATETAQALHNVEQILTAAGTSLRDVAKCNVYLVDLGDFAAMNDVYRSFFPSEPPARTTVGVAQLVLGARVEIECIARSPRAR